MKKDTLIEIILGTIGGLIFAFGMCMCLIPEWNMFTAGVILTIIGFIVLLSIIPIYRKAHPRKEHKPIDKGLLATWVIGVIGALIMGFGMSQIFTNGNMVIGIIFGIVGLIICVLNYPIYAYIKDNK